MIKQAPESFGPISVRSGRVLYSALIHSCNNPVAHLPVWKDKWPLTPRPEVCGNKSYRHPKKAQLCVGPHTWASFGVDPFHCKLSHQWIQIIHLYCPQQCPLTLLDSWEATCAMAVPHMRFDWSFITFASPTHFYCGLAFVKRSGTQEREWKWEKETSNGPASVGVKRAWVRNKETGAMWLIHNLILIGNSVGKCRN